MMNRPRGNAALNSRRRKKKQDNQLLMAIALLVVAAVLIALGIVLLVNNGGREDKQAMSVTTLEARPEATVAAVEATSAPTPVPEPTATPEPDTSYRSVLRPEPAREGWLPVFKNADTTEPMIAITVDDCYQAENLRQIVDKAIEVGGRLTIFPIGENVIREKHSQILKYAWENGMELENHTYTHNGLYRCSDAELAKEIYWQNLTLSYILGVDYECHFLRPKGGDARNDQRIHAYSTQMGYKGIAHWSQSGSGSSITRLKERLAPGEIYLFHTTDKDLALLLEFIPYAVEQGYKLVTMNEMFAYPENATGAPFTQVEDYPIPPLEHYDVVYVTLKKGTYSYGVKVLQERLIQLGLLKGEADGCYGDGTAKAVGKFQQKVGLEATGKADAATQEKLFDGQDPRMVA